MKYNIASLVLGLITLSISAWADRPVDTFSAILPSKKMEDSFSAPTVKHYVAFKTHAPLDSKLTIGGSRSASINIKKGSSITGVFDVKSGIYRVTYAKGSGGWAFLSYNGRKGERRKLSADLGGGKYSDIGITLKSAPSKGKLTLTLHSGGKFKQHSIEISGPDTYSFPLSVYKDINLARIDTIGVELHVEDATEALVFEFSSIQINSKKSG